jgi:hypothetical protein
MKRLHDVCLLLSAVAQNHYNFHPGNGHSQPAMITIQHENPSQQDFKTVAIRFPSVLQQLVCYLISLVITSPSQLRIFKKSLTRSIAGFATEPDSWGHLRT